MTLGVGVVYILIDIANVAHNDLTVGGLASRSQIQYSIEHKLPAIKR